MIDLVKPEYQTCVRYTEKIFWDNIILSKELKDFIEFTFPRINEMQSIYWVVGKRGSGKSQVLEIIARYCMEHYQSWRILPIVIPIESLSSNSEPDEVSATFCQQIAKNLIYLEGKFYQALDVLNIPPEDIWGSKIISELSKYKDKFEPEKFSDIFQLKTLLKHISQGKISYVLLIDELDKIDPMSYFNFLIHNQTMFSDLIEAKAKMFISMSPDVYNLIMKKEGEEANYFRSEEIKPPIIVTIDDCKQLIESRIRMKKKDWYPPFDNASYSVILRNCEGVPRKILMTTGNIIEKAYKANKPNIPHEYVIDYFEKGETDKEFMNFVSKTMGDITPLSRKIKELENRDFAGILNVFLMDKLAARKGDFQTFQSLGLKIDKTKYNMLVKEMETKRLLIDRGFGYIIDTDLNEYLESVKEKWEKNPLDLSDSLTNIKTSPAIEISEEIKEQTYDGEPIDKSIMEITSLNPFITSQDIKENLKNYQKGKDLERWIKVLPVRLAYLIRYNKITKINSSPELYALNLDGISETFVIQVNDTELLKEITQLYKFLKSDDSSEKTIFINGINDLTRKIISKVVDFNINRVNDLELKDLVVRNGFNKLSKYFEMYSTAKEIDDLEMMYSNCLRIIMDVYSIVEMSNKLRDKKEMAITDFTSDMLEISSLDLIPNILTNNKEKQINILLDNLDNLCIPVDETQIPDVPGLKKGSVVRCECGMELISDSNNIKHIGCSKNGNVNETSKNILYFNNSASKSIFVLSIIENIIKRILENKSVKYQISRFITNNGEYSYIVDMNNSLINITNKEIDRESYREPLIYIIDINFQQNENIRNLKGFIEAIEKINILDNLK